MLKGLAILEGGKVCRWCSGKRESLVGGGWGGAVNHLKRAKEGVRVKKTGGGEGGRWPWET